MLRENAPSRNVSCYQELRAVMALTQTTIRLRGSKRDRAVRTVADTNHLPVVAPCECNDSAEMLVPSERPQVGNLDRPGHVFCPYCMKDCGCLQQHSHFHWSKSPDMAIFTFPVTQCVWKTAEGWILTSPTTAKNCCFELRLTFALAGSLWKSHWWCLTGCYF